MDSESCRSIYYMLRLIFKLADSTVDHGQSSQWSFKLGLNALRIQDIGKDAAFDVYLAVA